MSMRHTWINNSNFNLVLQHTSCTQISVGL